MKLQKNKDFTREALISDEIYTREAPSDEIIGELQGICKGSSFVWWNMTNFSESPTLDDFAVGDKKHNWGEDRLTNYCFGKRRTLATLAREGAGGLFDKQHIESHLNCHL